MKIRLLVPVVLATVALLGARRAEAQSSRHDWTVTPRVGWAQPSRTFRPAVVDDTSSIRTGIRSAPALGVAVGFEPEGRVLGVRLVLGYTASTLVSRTHAGWESCGSSCWRAVDSEQSIAGASFFTAMSELTARGPTIGWVQPRIGLGGGVQRYQFSESEQIDAASLRPQSETVPAVSASFGLNVDLGRATLSLEARDLISRTEGFYRTGQHIWAPATGLRHNGEFSVGVRLPLH